MSMPSLDIFRSSPPTEQLRIESEPPGADVRTAEGQTCRTPCELTVPTTGELAITFALEGYESMTVPVRSEAPTPAVVGEPAGPPRLQPNPVYAELQPIAPARPVKKKRRAPVKRRPVAKRVAPAPAPAPAPPPAAAEPTVAVPPPAQPAAPATSSNATNYPWPPPPPPQ
jgi:hypothetical protein